MRLLISILRPTKKRNRRLTSDRLMSDVFASMNHQKLIANS